MEYRLRAAIGIRVVGFGCVALVLPLLVELARRMVDAFDVPVVSVAVWVLLLLPAALMLVGGWLLLDRRPRLRLDADGITTRTAYGLKATTTPWKQVRGVRRMSTASGPVLVVEHEHDSTATIPARYLHGDVARMEEQLRSRLNAAYGYRPLNEATTTPPTAEQ